jgi:hypothetical protein
MTHTATTPSDAFVRAVVLVTLHTDGAADVLSLHERVEKIAADGGARCPSLADLSHALTILQARNLVKAIEQGAFDFELSDDGTELVAHKIGYMEKHRESTSPFAVAQRLSWEGNA